MGHNNRMPAPARSTNAASRWFSQPLAVGAMAVEQAELIPQLTAQIGVRGLYLRPAPEVPRELSGNMLQSLTALHCAGDGWEGDLRCDGLPLPLGNESFSLIYLLHVLEQCDDPRALLRECARCLQPEGLLLVLVFNRWSPFRWRWPAQGVRPLSSSSVERDVEGAGLSIEQRSGVGCLWRGRREQVPIPSRLHGLAKPWLSSQAIIARKRRVAPTLVGPAAARLRARVTPS